MVHESNLATLDAVDTMFEVTGQQMVETVVDLPVRNSVVELDVDFEPVMMVVSVGYEPVT